MNKIRIVIFFTIVPFFCKAQLGDAYNFIFKNYSTLQGLPDNAIVKTVKDNNGFLWIATHNGISRFDGLKFKNYTHNPTDSNSLRSIWVSDLLIDENHTLWASTEWGLCFYDVAKDAFHYINDRSNLQLVFKMPLCKYDKNTIWIAAEDGLKKVNTITKTFTNTALTRIIDPQFVVKNAEGNLLIGTRGKGLFFYNTSSNSYQFLSFKNISTDTHFMDAWVEKDTTWIACSEGLIKLVNNKVVDLYDKYYNETKAKKVTALMCVSPFNTAFTSNYFICGTYDKKLFLFDKQQKKFTYQWLVNAANSDGFLASVVYALYEDNHNFWIGTNRGLSQINLQNQQQQKVFIPALQSENNPPFIKKLIVDSSFLINTSWLIPSKPYLGIVYYNTKQQHIVKEWNTFKSKTPYQYNDFILSKQQHQIVAVRDSAIDFFSIKSSNATTIFIARRPICIKENIVGNFWIGTDNGLVFCNVKNSKVEYFTSNFEGTDLEKNSFGGNFPIADLQIVEDNIWIANAKFGLFKFNISAKKFEPYRQKNEDNFSTLNRCSSLEMIGKDSLWLGNMAGLSCYVISQNKFINYDAKDGLKSTYVYSTVKDKYNNIWCRGNADVFCFNPITQKIISTKLHPQADIFSFDQRLTVAGNNILLGHEAGFTVFNSIDFVKQNYTVPNIQITNCKVNDVSNYALQNELFLKYNQNQISFDFVATEYNNPSSIEYFHMLEGIDKTWIKDGENRSVNYLNLSSGKFTFLVYALNSRNGTKSEVAHFVFTIKPATWQYWWFWPLLGLFFIAVVLFVARRRIAEIRLLEKQKTAANKSLAELETKMLRSQMNPHFIFNSLNSIQKYIWENKEEDAAEYLATFAKLIRAILENSRKEHVLLSEEIKVIKLYVALEHRRSNANFNYHIRLAENINADEILIPPLLLQPFIENAIWHGINKKDSKGNLDIFIQIKNNALQCIIEDDGVGRQQKKQEQVTEKKSLGIAITQQRIDRLIESTQQQASVVITDKMENNEAKGTLVSLLLPLIKI